MQSQGFGSLGVLHVGKGLSPHKPRDGEGWPPICPCPCPWTGWELNLPDLPADAGQGQWHRHIPPTCATAALRARSAPGSLIPPLTGASSTVQLGLGARGIIWPHWDLLVQGDRDPFPLGAALPWHCHCLSLLPSFAGKLHFFLQIHRLPLSLKMFLGALILPSLLGPCGAHGLGSGSIISPLNNTPQPSRSHE